MAEVEAKTLAARDAAWAHPSTRRWETRLVNAPWLSAALCRTIEPENRALSRLQSDN
jgi:hypothetical protein